MREKLFNFKKGDICNVKNDGGKVLIIDILNTRPKKALCLHVFGYCTSEWNADSFNWSIRRKFNLRDLKCFKSGVEIPKGIILSVES